MTSHIAASIIVMAAFCAYPTLCFGHSWYPTDCCSERDCMPADSVGVDARGDLEVTAGPLRIWVPKGFAIRPSLDSRAHICFREEKDLKFLMPLCLFVPAGS